MHKRTYCPRVATAPTIYISGESEGAQPRGRARGDPRPSLHQLGIAPVRTRPTPHRGHRRVGLIGGCKHA